MRSFLKENDMMAYLAMMAVRLLELRRVLKATGSLYLHCDPTASHYLKILMDAIFGRSTSKRDHLEANHATRQCLVRVCRIHDMILLYSKGEQSIWNPQHVHRVQSDA